ncbi:Acetyl-coenzyme A carboxyl transferase beta chain [hydrothermal vent metagenome]|uniref:Acetyl-coenzyme A carboxyl transferase beta chain n=1 Tax=hydrothermal vent metagenome TaxID=652676 RepID=A0A3B0T077_9ZZZZ
MNWIKSFVRPKIRGILGVKKETPDNMWIKCPQTGEMVFYRDLEANQFVIPSSDYHMNWKPKLRLEAMFDDGAYENITFPEVAVDPLKFRDQKKYTDRLKAAKAATDQPDAIVTGYGKLHDLPIVMTVQDFKFMGGSLGMAAGEALIVSMQLAVEKKCPYVLFVASGGARMQEGILSLMQMPRTTVAVQELRAANLPYIVVFTDPTTGGVTASYAMLGDIHIAEPNARIGFAGARVIEQTIREKLPPGFQRSEYLLDHGMVDLIVHRADMRDTVARIARMLMKAPEIDMSKSVAVDQETAKDGTSDEPTKPATEKEPAQD